MPKRIIYSPPSRQVINDYARKVCERLAEKYGASYATPDAILGLSAFLQVSARIVTKHLNSSCEIEDKVDNQTK